MTTVPPSAPLSIYQLVSPTGGIRPPAIEWVTLNWDDRQKARQRLLTDQGTEILLSLPRGTVLAAGDILYQDDQLSIEVSAQPESVIIVPFQSMLNLGRVTHQLGNWHRPSQILHDGTVLAQADQPLADWLQQGKIPFQIDQKPFHANLRGHSH